jgi:hypothetical protein
MGTTSNVRLWQLLLCFAMSVEAALPPLPTADWRLNNPHDYAI